MEAKMANGLMRLPFHKSIIFSIAEEIGSGLQDGEEEMGAIGVKVLLRHLNRTRIPKEYLPILIAQLEIILVIYEDSNETVLVRSIADSIESLQAGIQEETSSED